MKRSGVFVTAEELAKVVRLSNEARSTPVMLVGGVDLSASAHDLVSRECVRLNRKYGQPEDYGLDPRNGEFVSR